MVSWERHGRRPVGWLGWLVVVGVLAWSWPVFAAADPTGRQIMDHVDKDHRTDDEKARADMVLMAKGEPPRRRRVDLYYAAAEGDDDNFVIRFVEPVDISGTALLTLEKSEGETQYVYLPALRKTRRIASGSKTERFAGTDFTYEDLRTEQLDQYRYEVVRSESLDGVDCWVVEATPATEARQRESGYARRLIWVRKGEYLAVKVDFFDLSGRHHKTLRHLDWKQVDGVWRFFKADMQDHLRESRTLMKYAERTVNPGLDERTFTKQALARG